MQNDFGRRQLGGQVMAKKNLLYFPCAHLCIWMLCSNEQYITCFFQPKAKSSDAVI